MMPAEIHPGPSAGSGKLEPRRTTYKRGDRVIELRRCAQCGFLNRDGFEVIGDSMDSPGVQQVSTVVTVALDANKVPQPLKGMTKFSQTSVTYTIPNTVSGCRLCGSLNSPGNYRRIRDYGTGKDLSNR